MRTLVDRHPFLIFFLALLVRGHPADEKFIGGKSKEKKDGSLSSPPLLAESLIGSISHGLL